MISRRSILRTVPLLIAAPAIVRVASLMPVKAFTSSTEQTLTFSMLPGGINYVSASMLDMIDWEATMRAWAAHDGCGHMLVNP